MPKYSLWITLILLISTGFVQAVVQPDEIVLYWTFEDGQVEQAVDVSGRAHDGVITDGELVDGRFGIGLKFNGSSSFIELAHHDDFNLADGYTIAVWAMIDDLPLDHIGLPRKQGSYIVHPSKAGDGFNFQTYINNGGNKLVHEGVVPFGEWHHLASTYDLETGRSWVDAQVVVEKASVGEVAASPGEPLRWSNDCCGGRMLDGILDEIVIINRALNEDEMATLMEMGAVPTTVDAAGKLTTRWADVKSR